MNKNIKTHLYCFDDHRGYSEQIKKKFPDTSRYIVLSYQTREDYLTQFKKEKENNYCKIAILVLYDNREQYEMFDRLVFEIKNIDPLTGIILICPPDRTEEISKIIKFNIDAIIPQNSNAILRIHNTVKKLMSEHSIGIFKKRRNFSLLILSAFIILSALLLLLAYLKMPKYF